MTATKAIKFGEGSTHESREQLYSALLGQLKSADKHSCFNLVVWLLAEVATQIGISEEYTHAQLESAFDNLKSN